MKEKGIIFFKILTPTGGHCSINELIGVFREEDIEVLFGHKKVVTTTRWSYLLHGHEVEFCVWGLGKRPSHTLYATIIILMVIPIFFCIFRVGHLPQTPRFHLIKTS